MKERRTNLPWGWYAHDPFAHVNPMLRNLDHLIKTQLWKNVSGNIHFHNDLLYS